MKRPTRDKILQEFIKENKVAYGSIIEDEYLRRLESYVDYLESKKQQK